MKILVTGLPGSGKTTFSNKLFEAIQEKEILVALYNGDHMREYYDDWDFSDIGRFRQLCRMTQNSEMCCKNGIIAICDFICPLNLYRNFLQPQITVWMDTIKESKYEDTNKLFEKPDKYDIHITDFEQNEIDNVLRLIDVKRYICDR
jgi:adenylylsulfate kinase